MRKRSSAAAAERSAGFSERYGPWAVIAGASEGIGAAFAAALAKQGLDLVLVARRPEPLAALAESLPVRTLTVAADLATSEGVEVVLEATADLEVGLVICNAAYSPIGPFLDTDPALTHRALRLNCAAPLALAHAYLPVMALRKRGGFVIMSSLAGAQGSPGIAVYAATKAFGAVLAEGLWDELRHHGVDVITAVAGAVATPGLAKTQTRRAPGTVSPAEVADATLRALGSRPRTVPGGLMKVSSALISRLLPRRAAIAMFARASRNLEPPP
jgi:short-subunit dehydrogenase